jgi:membrane complex biogenesis BtpA family protein
LGINILFNDWQAEVAVAAAAGADYIRVEVLVDPSISDMGMLDASAPALLRMRAALQSSIKIFADVQGKYTAPARPRPITESAQDAETRGGADALIITGSGTGHLAPISQLAEVKGAVSVPVLAGSGVTPETVKEILDVADGAIVGSYFKVDGQLRNHVDPDRVRRLVSAANMVRG